MALSKSIEHASGVSMTYHKVGIISPLTPAQKSCGFIVWSYVDENARDAGKVPVTTKAFTLQDTDYDAYLNETVLKGKNVSTLSQLYAYLKTLAEWDGAQDC